jgi:hypothetical protein|tara:strand:+ start:973 stop:1371 length:399 start_codon:yes stop_codon:yes gene_type:complete
MDKGTVFKGFNKLLFDFLDDLSTLYPESKEIAQAKKTFSIFKTANPTILIKTWHSKIYVVYQKEIDSGDISFFFDKDYSSDLKNVVGSDEIMNMIENIRQPLKEMDATNKQHCSNYIIKLSKLSVLYQDLIK